MRKGKPPRKRKALNTEPADSEREVERLTQEKAELVPPRRRPPTAVGADTPPPHREPPEPARPLPERQRPRPVRQPEHSALATIVDAIRVAAGVLVDLADAAADTLMRQIERRA